MAVPITVNDVSKGFYAAWRLLHRDREAVSLLDNTLEGVKKSFWCAAIILPAYVLFLLFEIGTPVDEIGNIGNTIAKAGLFNAWAAEMAFFVMSWVAWPLAMDRIAPWFERDENYFRYLISYNWAHGLRIVLLVGYMALRFSGMVPEDLVGLLKLSVLVVFWAYHWFLLRNVLGVEGGAAALLVAAEFAMIVAINQMATAVAM